MVIMTVCGIFVAFVMSSMFIVPMTASMVIIPLFIFFFTRLVRLVPGCLYEDLECRVQVDDHEEKSETDNPKDREEDNLYFCDREKRDNRRNQKGEHEKKYRYDNRPKVEEDHRIVEMESDPDMSYCHACRWREGCDDSLILEYDKEFRIRETHI